MKSHRIYSDNPFKWRKAIGDTGDVRHHMRVDAKRGRLRSDMTRREWRAGEVKRRKKRRQAKLSRRANRP